MLKTNETLLKERLPKIHAKLHTLCCEHREIKVEQNGISIDGILTDNRDVKTTRLRPIDTIVVYGFGCGNTLRRIIEHSPKSNLVCIETDLCVIKKALESVDLSDILKFKNLILVTPEENRLQRTLQLTIEILKNKLTWGNVIEYQIPGYENIKQFPLKKAREILKKLYSPILLNRNTLIGFSQTISENIIKNIPDMVHGTHIDKLRNLFKDTPVVIVASGPSLSKNIDLLHEVKGKIPIIAVDSVVSILLNKNIHPDIMCGVDYKQVTMEKYTPILKLKKKSDITYICEGAIHYSIPKLFRHTIFNHQPSSLIKYYEEITGKMEMDKLSINAVTHLAMLTAYITGANPIILIGQDWAYSGAMDHAKGVYLEGKIPGKILWIKGNYQERVPTDANLMSGLQIAEIISARFKERGIRVINATEGGAFISNTELMTFREAIDTFIRKGISYKPITLNSDKPNFRQFVEATSRIKKDIQELIKESSKALKLDYEIEKKWKKTRRESDIAKLVKESNRINDELTFSFILSNVVAQYYFEEFFNFYQEEVDIEGHTTEKRIEQSIKYFRLIREKSQLVLKKIEELELHLKLLEEYYSNKEIFLQNIDSVLKLCKSLVAFRDMYRGLEIAKEAAGVHDRAELYYYMGKFYGMNVFTHRESIECYEEALSRNPKFEEAKFDLEVEKKKPESHFILAQKAINENNLTLAKRFIRRVLLMEPNNNTARKWLKTIEEAEHSEKQAIQQKLLFNQLKEDSISYSTYKTAFELIKSNKLDEAFSNLMKLYNTYGAFGDVPFLLGSILIDKGKIDEAERYIRETIDHSGYSPFVHLALGKIYLIKNNPSLAMEHLEKAVEDKEELKPEVGDILGNLYFQVKDYTKAIEYFRAHLPISPDKSQTVTKIAMCYKALGLEKEYEVLIKKAKELKTH